MIILRPRQGSDTERLLTIARRVHDTDGYPPYFPDLDFRVLLFGHESLGVWVAEIDDEVVGQVALHPRTGTAAMEVAARVAGVTPDMLGVVARLLVAPENRQKGVGHALLTKAASEAVARGLHPMLDVATHLQPAIHLYEACGWSRAGQVSVEFSDGTKLDEFVYLDPVSLPRRPSA